MQSNEKPNVATVFRWLEDYSDREGKKNKDKNLIRISDAVDVTRGLNSLFTLVIKIDQKSRMEKLDWIQNTLGIHITCGEENNCFSAVIRVGALTEQTLCVCCL